jgi:lipopolysaccharide export system permease protein
MIKILYTYIIKKFTKIFLLTVVILSLVIIILESFKHIALYIGYDNTSFNIIILYLISKLPKWLMQILPMATLLALLFSLEDLSKKNEITAMKSAGINMWWIIIMFLIIGFIIGICDFTVREFIVPKTSLWSEIIKKEKIQKAQISVQTDFYDQIVVFPNNVKMTIGHINSQTNIMRNIAIEKYNNDFAIQRLIVAEKAIWKNGSWILKNGVVRNFKDSFWNEIYFKNYNPKINITPENLSVKTMRCDSMNIRELKKYIERLEIFGQITVNEKFILNARFASVFAHVIVMMIGIPFATGFVKKSSKLLSFTLALCATFAYWSTEAISKSLSENFILSPPIAAWLPNIIFSTIGIYFLVKVKK